MRRLLKGRRERSVPLKEFLEGPSKTSLEVGEIIHSITFSRLSGAWGAAFQFPTADSESLGTGKYALGPSVDYEYESGKWFAGFIALNLWSVAGDSEAIRERCVHPSGRTTPFPRSETERSVSIGFREM